MVFNYLVIHEYITSKYEQHFDLHINFLNCFSELYKNFINKFKTLNLFSTKFLTKLIDYS